VVERIAQPVSALCLYEITNGQKFNLVLKMKKKRFRFNQRGFTLMEIISMLLILSVLAATAIAKYIDLETSQGWWLKKRNDYYLLELALACQ
jgi:prepilin-type N-terminal cleavage/methylation domain-containing protein